MMVAISAGGRTGGPAVASLAFVSADGAGNDWLARALTRFALTWSFAVALILILAIAITIVRSRRGIGGVVATGHGAGAGSALHRGRGGSRCQGLIWSRRLRWLH